MCKLILEFTIAYPVSALYYLTLVGMLYLKFTKKTFEISNKREKSNG